MPREEILEINPFDSFNILLCFPKPRMIIVAIIGYLLPGLEELGPTTPAHENRAMSGSLGQGDLSFTDRTPADLLHRVILPL